MRQKLNVTSLMRYAIGFVLAVSAAGMSRVEANREAKAGATQVQNEFTFSLTRLPENPKQYGLAISGSDEAGISGYFSLDQLQILRAIMTEAETFALGGEAVGTSEPVTTRFIDKRETAFIVDVEKLGNQSRLYLTLKTELGRMTADAGRIIRSTKREEGFFFDLLSRLDSILPKLPAKQAK